MAGTAEKGDEDAGAAGSATANGFAAAATGAARGAPNSDNAPPAPAAAAEAEGAAPNAEKGDEDAPAALPKGDAADTATAPPKGELPAAPPASGDTPTPDDANTPFEGVDKDDAKASATAADGVAAALLPLDLRLDFEGV